MSNITVEFFHDVICSFCFPMSQRMRKLQEMMPEVEIVHRSFALAPAEEDLARMFGSRAAAKEEILGHWEHANQNDDLHRFQIEGMRRATFPFPTSTKPLLACKAAYFIAGDGGYWDVFDALQKALFVQNRNIEAQDVIEACVADAGIDLAKWREHYESAKTREAVEEDLRLARQYAIQGVPCLILNGKQRISGAQPLSRIVDAVRSAKGEAGDMAGAACRMEQGEMHCG